MWLWLRSIKWSATTCWWRATPNAQETPECSECTKVPVLINANLRGFEPHMASSAWTLPLLQQVRAHDPKCNGGHGDDLGFLECSGRIFMIIPQMVLQSSILMPQNARNAPLLYITLTQGPARSCVGSNPTLRSSGSSASRMVYSAPEWSQLLQNTPVPV